jgi:inorganic pyrophosphatase/exopolyphosphatase
MMSVSGNNPDTCQSLADFLKVRKTDPSSSKHYVLGNEAGDADSIISAIALAYIDSIQPDVTIVAKTPLISIPRADLATQRPETALLVDLAGYRTPSMTSFSSTIQPLSTTKTTIIVILLKSK